ncbi:hypothetical protein J3R83DRAFT_6749 [Lanmaoa asiatica]|nr:hypothetical protein J3R83DRAFT_6749 [Lanmaoa asiatica]
MPPPVLPPLLRLTTPEENNGSSNRPGGSELTIKSFRRVFHHIVFPRRLGTVGRLERVAEATAEDENAVCSSRPSNSLKRRTPGRPASRPSTTSIVSQSTCSHISTQHSSTTLITPFPSPNVSDMPPRSPTNKSPFSAILLAGEDEEREEDDSALALWRTEQLHRARLAKLTRHLGEEIPAEMVLSPAFLSRGTSRYSVHGGYHHKRRSLDLSAFVQESCVTEFAKGVLQRSKSLSGQGDMHPTLSVTGPETPSTEYIANGVRSPETTTNTIAIPNPAPSPSTISENHSNPPVNIISNGVVLRERASMDMYSESLPSRSSRSSVEISSETSPFYHRASCVPPKSRKLYRRPATADWSRRAEKLANFFGVDHEDASAVSQTPGIAQKLQIHLLAQKETFLSPIFQDESGLAVKFFIQKDIPQEIQAELCETITSLGGRVESKVPRQGYVLTQPGTPEEERLRLCWISPDRPERHFVPYTYIDACKIAGMLLKQIFVEKGVPIKMHIHPSIANVNARAALSQRIMHSGGDPTASPQSARVILADPNTEVFQHLVKSYQGVPDKYIESYLWVKKCVEKGALVYTPLVYKNPGGRRPGEERTQFTEEDEERLCQWIATKIPYKETGGRTGNRLYQQLCEMAVDPEYAWVTRHTWQSWRERYKKNSVRLDNMITAIVDQKKPAHGEKGQYGYVRQAEEKTRRMRKKRTKPVDESLQADHAERQTAGCTDGNANPTVPIILFTPEQISSEPQASVSGIHARQSPDEEEMADGEESEEWRIRVGNQSPPPWGKRKADDEGSDEPHTTKKTKTIVSSPHSNTFVAPITFASEDGQAVVPLHCIDQAIYGIANEFRFTVQEVKEFYDRCGEMDRTRTRFQRMRQLLNSVDDSIGDGADSL